MLRAISVGAGAPTVHSSLRLTSVNAANRFRPRNLLLRRGKPFVRCPVPHRAIIRPCAPIPHSQSRALRNDRARTPGTRTRTGAAVTTRTHTVADAAADAYLRYARSFSPQRIAQHDRTSLLADDRATPSWRRAPPQRHCRLPTHFFSTAAGISRWLYGTRCAFLLYRRMQAPSLNLFVTRSWVLIC